MEFFYKIVSVTLVGGSVSGFALAAAAFAKGRRPATLAVAGAMFCFLLGEVYWLTYLSIEGAPPSGFHVTDLSFIGYYLFLITGDFGLMNGIICKEAGKRRARFAALAAPAAMVVLSAALIQLGRNAFTTIVYLIPSGILTYFALRNLLVARQSPTAAKMRGYYACNLLVVFLIELSYVCGVLGDPVGNGAFMIAAGLALVAQSVTAVMEVPK